MLIWDRTVTDSELSSPVASDFPQSISARALGIKALKTSPEYACHSPQAKGLLLDMAAHGVNGMVGATVASKDHLIALRARASDRECCRDYQTFDSTMFELDKRYGRR